MPSRSSTTPSPRSKRAADTVTTTFEVPIHAGQTFSVSDAVELAVVERSGFVESRHAGSAVVLTSEGAVLRALGDVTTPIFPRSSMKPFQAIAVMASGVTLRGEDAAIATASHTGTQRHADLVRGLLDPAGGLRVVADGRLSDQLRSLLQPRFTARLLELDKEAETLFAKAHPSLAVRTLAASRLALTDVDDAARKQLLQGRLDAFSLWHDRFHCFLQALCFPDGKHLTSRKHKKPQRSRHDV